MNFKKQIFKKYLINAPLITLILGAFFHLEAKDTIKDLTSKEKAREVPAVSKPTLFSTPIKIHSIGIGLGQTSLHGAFSDLGDDKVTADLYYNYSASRSFDLTTNFHYSKHEYRGAYASLSGLNMGIKGKIFQFDSFAPFVVGGFGFYSPKVKRIINEVALESSSKLVFGLHLGGGAELNLNRRFSIGLLGHYHNPFDVKQDNQGKVEGSYFKLLITTFYHF